LQKNPFTDINKHWLRVKVWKKIYQANGPPKQETVAILISDKLDFGIKSVRREKEMSLQTNKRNNTTRGNNNCQLICTQCQVPNLTEHTLLGLKTQIHPNTVIVGNFNIPLSPVQKSSRKKFNKEFLELNGAIDQMHLTDVYRVFHLTTPQYMLLSVT
jgi:hypothetical protein